MTNRRTGARLRRPNPDLDAGCFLVLGVPRGGTSVVTGLLRLAGVPMGEFIDETNQEDLEFLHIGHELRTHRESNMDDPRRVDARQRFRNLHDFRAAQFGIWGFKDPTLIDYLSDVIEFVKNPRLICVFRDPVATAMREEMAGNPFDASLRLTLARQSRVVEFADSGNFPALFVSYEKLLLRPWETFGVISNFVTGAVDDDLHATVIRYVVPERATASIENVVDESLESDSQSIEMELIQSNEVFAGGRQKTTS